VGKIDRSDPDFGFLFEFREGLERLGDRLQALELDLENGIAIPTHSQELASAIKESEWLNSRDYRRDVLRKYGIDLSDPESNQ
jgi:hypothetical protein